MSQGCLGIVAGVLYLTEIFGLGLCSSLHIRGSQAPEASNCLEGLLKLRHQQVSFLANSGWDLRICFSNKFPGSVLIQSIGSWPWCTQNYQQSCATDNFNQTLRRWDQKESRKFLLVVPHSVRLRTLLWRKTFVLLKQVRACELGEGVGCLSFVDLGADCVVNKDCHLARGACLRNRSEKARQQLAREAEFEPSAVRPKVWSLSTLGCCLCEEKPQSCRALLAWASQWGFCHLFG